MEKLERLKDGTEIIIREMREDDIDKSLKFFRALPEDDRRYLRRDVTREEIVHKRIEEMKRGDVLRLVAIKDDEIIADGALEMTEYSWAEEIGELRLIVSRKYQHKGVGTLLARELYFLAVKNNLKKIVVKMMRPQIAARKIFKKLGFREEHLFPEYVKDQTGIPQDLIIMTCDIEEMWKELEHIFFESDWRRHR
jgi:RimJ/RimL family protein N-acetyltransferase